MRSLRDGRRHDRPVHRHFGGATRGLAIDLGSSRTRAWVPGLGVVADTGGEESGEYGHGRPVRRGRIVDPDSCGRMLARIADRALGDRREDAVIVLSHPVLAGPGHRDAARDMLRTLNASDVIVLDSARAAAACAGPGDGGPLLVLDIGAELTEATLLVDGMVRDARLAETGLSDLGPGEPPTAVVQAVLDMVMAMWRQDRHGALLGALRRGPLLTGGGALRPDVTNRTAVRLGVPVRLTDDPATTVVRGAGLILSSVLRHTAAPALPGRSG
ncbi:MULTISPECIES: rod shape-determining protein MreC [unclassified Streptomyces]|uniref:rod shape-determining protein MreC n=1 Tax=unclassified Streptomyces TaxID=2593676 RepID=UPI002ED02461|nr:rod shape-determining protein [Streptomyces sp. NBC_00891]WSY08847.1 rod shape-determining protein [Streptomyces sp. NBC_00890]WSZ10470.1 rod shape-determining protein [Streptomyces sp. NBC_00869]WSZ22027.1 rod shape-determining protein [Streptomyces sp. NBC_00870]